MAESQLDKFIESQLGCIATGGLIAYLPSLWVIGWWSVKVHVLTDVPEDQDHGPIARAWAAKIAGRRDYLLGFRSSDNQFTAVARVRGETIERIVTVPAEFCT